MTTEMETKPTALRRGMPKAANNGLYGLEEYLMAHPDDLVVAVVKIGVDEIEQKVKRGQQYPVVELLHIEPLREDADVAAALALLKRAADARSGDAQLDIDGEAAPVEPPLDLDRPLADGPTDDLGATVTPIGSGRVAPAAEQPYQPTGADE